MIMALLALLILLAYSYSVFYDVPFVPTPMRIVRRMLSMAELKPGEVLYDLGSGDGRVIITAAEEFGARAVGVELNPIRVYLSKLRVSRLGLQDRVEVRRQSFFEADLREADVVSMYLLPEINEKLKPKLKEELKRGARVVVYAFIIKGWKPTKSDSESKIFVYQI